MKLIRISFQRGEIPSMGLGTATLHDQVCVDAVRAAIRAGIRHIDTVRSMVKLP